MDNRITRENLEKIGFTSPPYREWKYDGSSLIFDLGHLYLSLGVLGGLEVLLMDNEGKFTGISFKSISEIVKFGDSIGFMF